MNILVYILFFLVAVGQLGRISFNDQSINIYLYEIVMGVMVIGWLIQYNTQPLREHTKLNKYLFMFVGILVFSFFLSLNKYTQSQNIIAGLHLARLLFYFFYFIYLVYFLRKNIHILRTYRKAVFVFISITALTCVVQYFFYPNLRNLAYLGWDPHQHRIFGLFFDTSIAAGMIGLIILYLIKFKKNLWGKYGIVTFSIIGLFTYSRAFYLSILMTLVLFLIKKKEYIWMSILLGGAMVSFFILPRPQGEGVNLLRSFSIESRINDDKEALQTFVKDPVLGIGYNHIQKTTGTKEVESANHARASYHSSFLIILVTTGIFGLVSFMLVLYRLGQVSEISQLYVIFLSIFSLFDNVILHPFILFLFFNLIALESTRHR